MAVLLGGRGYSEQTAREIDCAVRDIVNKAFANAVDILTRRRHLLEASARRQMEKETLDEDDLRGLREALPAAAKRRQCSGCLDTRKMSAVRARCPVVFRSSC